MLNLVVEVLSSVNEIYNDRVTSVVTAAAEHVNVFVAPTNLYTKACRSVFWGGQPLIKESGVPSSSQLHLTAP